MFKVDVNTKRQTFRGRNPLVNGAVFLDSRVLMNKAALDVACDVPIIMNANNKIERRERFNRAIIPWIIAYATPFITLPLTNRLAMKHIAKLSKFNGKEANIIKLSNKHLISVKALEENIKPLAEKFNVDLPKVLGKCGGDYEELRKKIVNAKTVVASFDYVFTTLSVGSIGFINNAMTKKTTRQRGFSAEFEMADKETIEKRAEKFSKREKKSKATFAGTIFALSMLPLAVRKGLLSSKSTKFSNLIKKYGNKFDYKDGIFMGRFPFFLMAIASYFGIFGASRNETELKDNVIRSAFSLTAFFGGDLLIGSTLARLSDKLLKTELLDKTAPKTLLNKIVPPTRRLEELTGCNKSIAVGLFWINLALLSGFIGWALPLALNKMIKKDVDTYIKEQDNQLNNIPQTNANVFKSMDEFLNKTKQGQVKV